MNHGSAVDAPRQSERSRPSNAVSFGKSVLSPCSCTRKPSFLSVAASCSSITTFTPPCAAAERSNGSFAYALRPTTRISSAPFRGKSAAPETSRTPTPSALRSGFAVPSGSNSATDFAFAAPFAFAMFSAKESRARQFASVQRNSATISVVPAAAANESGTCAVRPALTTTLPAFFSEPAFHAYAMVRSWRSSLTKKSDFSTFSPGRYASFTVVNSRPGPAIQPIRSA